MTVSDAGAMLAPQPKHHLRFGPHNIRMGFCHWRRSRPFWGGLWAILGGGMMMLGPLTALRFVLVAGQSIWVGILVGLLVSIFGLYLWFAPSMRQITAILITVLSVVSFITSDFGGFLIGMVLGVLGGSMAFAWMPRPSGTIAVTGRTVDVPAVEVQSQAVGGDVPAVTDRN